MPFALAAMLAAAVSSCDSVIYDNPDEPSPVEPQEVTATLQFQIATQATRNSRALNEDENDVNHQLGTADENYVDLQTLSFILADGDGKAIMPFYPTVTPEPDTDFKLYDVTAELPQAALNKTFSDDGDAIFQILVIANARTNGVERMPYGFSLESYETNPVMLSSCFGSDGSPTFQFPLSGNTANGWDPSITGARYIPMAGVQHFSVSKAALDKSTQEEPVKLSETQEKYINLLRAVARIDVKLSAASSPGISIASVSLTGYNTRGALLPEATYWQTDNLFETRYILNSETPTIPSNNTYSGASTLPLVSTGDTWSIYLPEYLARTESAPKFTVIFNNATGTGEPQIEDSFTLSQYVDGQAGGNISLIRNNLYTYELTKSVEVEVPLNINWTVCELDKMPTVTVPDFD